MTKNKYLTTKGDSRYRQAAFFRAEMQNKDDNALRTLLATKEGRWFIMSIMDNTFVNATTFTGNSVGNFNEGKRAVGINIKRKIYSLGKEGIAALQLAEREYIEFKNWLAQADQEQNEEE